MTESSLVDSLVFFSKSAIMAAGVEDPMSLFFRQSAEHVAHYLCPRCGGVKGMLLRGTKGGVYGKYVPFLSIPTRRDDFQWDIHWHRTSDFWATFGPTEDKPLPPPFTTKESFMDFFYRNVVDELRREHGFTVSAERLFNDFKHQHVPTCNLFRLIQRDSKFMVDTAIWDADYWTPSHEPVEDDTVGCAEVLDPPVLTTHFLNALLLEDGHDPNPDLGDDAEDGGEDLNGEDEGEDHEEHEDGDGH